MAVRIVLDRDCPRCGWPELIAVGEDLEAGPSYLECPKDCGWSARVLRPGEVGEVER